MLAVRGILVEDNNKETSTLFEPLVGMCDMNRAVTELEEKPLGSKQATGDSY